MTEPLCLDATVLADIRALSGPGEDLLAEVVKLFVADVPDQLVTLRAALDARDAVAARRIAHRLKGSALATGARRLAAACASVEDAAREGDVDRAAAAAATLDDEFRAVRAALERELHP